MSNITKTNKNSSKWEFIKTLIAAIAFATIIRSFFFEPFHIPSSSMYPSLIIGDYIFVSKFSYGYSRYSFPLELKLFSGRIFEKQPKRGDVVVFRSSIDAAQNNGREYLIKRIIGLPGDEIQIIEGQVYINGKAVKKEYLDNLYYKEAAIPSLVEMQEFKEELPEGKIIITMDQNPDLPQDNTGIYEVPKDHYFMMGDNRDNSTDSRFLTQMGYVAKENIIGQAKIIFFSATNQIWKFWKWNSLIRFDRILKKID
jgi:signal peptidase I